jgi:hypothetical protein
VTLNVLMSSIQIVRARTGCRHVEHQGMEPDVSDNGLQHVASQGVVQHLHPLESLGMNRTPEIAKATADLVQSFVRLIQVIMAANETLETSLPAQTECPADAECRPHVRARLQDRQFTTEPIKPVHTSGVLPEFGRWADVQRLFGIKRGKLYTLISEGKVKSVSLREKGQKFAVRLIHLDSVRNYIHQHMRQQEDEEA